jgi:Flp pilus assembly protein TadG
MHVCQTSRNLVQAANVFARFCRCDSGVNAIEFAFVVPLAIAIVLATVQVGVIFLAQSYLEYVAETGARLVLTNQAANNNWTQAQFAAQICSDVQALFNCNNLIVELEQAPSSAANMAAAMPQFDSNGNLTNPTSYSVLPAPAKMMLVVMYQWPVIGGPLGLNFGSLGNGNFLLVSTQVFQVEIDNTGN